MPSRVWRLFCLVCSLSVPAAPRAAEPAKRVALMLIEKGSPDRKLIDRFVASLSVIDVGEDSVSIMGRRELHGRLGPTYTKSVAACGADLRCIANIGDKADATHVLFGRATAEKGGVGLQWLLIEVETAAIVGKLKAKLTAAHGPDAAAKELARELLGIGAPVPDAPVGKAAAPARATATAAAPATAPGPAADPAPVPAPARQAASAWSTPGVVGSVALACGALAFGGGVYSARDDGKRANLLFAAGGALMLGGVAVWALDDVRVAPVAMTDGKLALAGVAGTW